MIIRNKPGTRTLMNTYDARFQYKDRKPYSRQQRDNIKRRKPCQKNNR